MTDQAVVGIILARGGSKGIPRKNLQLVGGVPLVQRAIETLSQAIGIASVYVSTDDPDIATLAKNCGCNAVNRPKEFSSDTASSEAALLHALNQLKSENIEPTTIVFVQCTSPFISAAEIKEGVELVHKGLFDSVFSAKETHVFLWGLKAGDRAKGINHREATQRQRRQDKEPEFRETGAFYIFNSEGFKHSKNRFFGKIGIIKTEMSEIEVDTYEDLQIANKISEIKNGKEALDTTNIRALVMDFDGVHTDDKVIILPDGSEAVTCSREDGYGLEKLKSYGFNLLILSKEKNNISQQRAKKLGITCLNSIDNKRIALEAWLKEHSLSWSEIAYIGNDENDVECMKKAGISFSPLGSHPSAKAASSGPSITKKGGEGAIREVAEIITHNLVTRKSNANIRR